MTAALAEATEQLPGLRRAAILLIVLGEHTGSALLKDLTEDEVQSVSREIAQIKTITAEQAEVVLEDFNEIITGRDFMAKGGLDYAKKMLQAAFGADGGKKAYERLVRLMGNDVANFDALHKADPQQLAKFIHSEHPQTIALILSHLSPSQAAALLTSLPPGMRSDVALRMANMDQISPDIIAKIAGIIGQKISALGEFSRESYGGVRAVSEMFNRLDSAISQEILDRIQVHDASLVESVRQLMFVFEDLHTIDETGIKELINRVDRKLLTIALKGTSDKLRTHFFSGMSQRAADMLREDMDALGPTKIKDVETAQQQIIAMVRQLESEGVISLKGGESQQYVV